MVYVRTPCFGTIAIIGSLISIFACGGEVDDTPEPEQRPCACEEAQCVDGRCTLRVMVSRGCGEAWGKASIFVNDVGADAEPVGYAREGEPWESCEGFEIGETFEYVVESEDGRRVTNTVGTEFSCAGARPFEVKLDCL